MCMGSLLREFLPVWKEIEILKPFRGLNREKKQRSMLQKNVCTCWELY